jgi:hypothetical protein
MSQSEHQLLDLLEFDLFKFEQYFLEDGGYGRSSHTPLMGCVPSGMGNQVSTRRAIPLTGEGETIDYFELYGTQLELENAFAHWLHEQINQIAEPREAEHSKNASGIDRLRHQWLAFAGNLYLLANLHRDYHNYVVAYALYGHALAAAENVAALGESGRSLITQIRKDLEAVSEILRGGERDVEQASTEELETVDE